MNQLENNRMNKEQTRSVPLTYNQDNNTCQVVISTGQRVLRTGFKPYWEELEITREAIDFSRLNNGAPVLDSHKYRIS